MVTRKTDETQTIEIAPILTETIVVAVRGARPLILNRMAEKARHELLLPKGRKSAADKAANLKHNPLEEFRSSPYTIADDDAPTMLAMPSSAFKGAMMQAALDLPGAKKAQIGRLVWVEGDMTPVYGIPELFMSVTRSADINRTPDIRTRAIVPEWAAIVTISFATPLLTKRSVVNLLAASGQLCGVGDWRPEKGKGTYGQFHLVDAEKDEAFKRIVASGGRAAQLAAMSDPAAYDQESEELLGWFDTELKVRGRAA